MRLENLNDVDANTLLKELNASSSKLEEAEAFLKLKAPSKKSEAYRYFDTDCIVKKDYEIVTPKESTFSIDKDLIIENGKVVTAPSSVTVEIKEFSQTDKEHFDSLYYLSHIICSKVIVITINESLAFNIKHILTTQKDQLLSYRVVVLTKANTHSTIYETIDDKTDQSLVIGGYDITAAKDATVNFVTDRNYSKSGCIVFSNSYRVEESATFNLYTFDYASNNALTLFRAQLQERANFNAKHLLYTRDKAKAGTVSQIIHRGQSSHSNQSTKNILDDNSRGIFDALIKVENSGKYTAAHQNSKAILLNEGAYMASKPQLEIYIDDLEASHGSTTGQLDKAQLLYLQSRGIKVEEAKKMLILGFANEIIDSIDNKEIAEKVHASFETAYYGTPKIECMQTCDTCL